MGRTSQNSVDKTLSTGRKVKIRELSIDAIDELKDIPEIYFLGDKQKTIKNVNKAQTAWIRQGLAGGDFEDWKPNGKPTPDIVIKQLTEQERLELVQVIQDTQTLNPKKPSN
tara:strand:- start:28192 stop:28527 length:336 start_codon:yes stop_codon:yes gene_type:complete